MGTSNRCIAFAVILLLAGATAASAQRRGVELGIDAIAAWHDPDNSSHTVFELAAPLGGLLTPLNGLRAGFSLSRLLSFEPTFGLDLENVLNDDEPSNTRVGLSSSLLIHTSSNADRALPFVAIGGNANYFDIDDMSDFQFGVHGFAGLKLPVGSDMAVRLTAGGGRSFETDELEAYWSVFATAGLSWWPGANGRVAVARR